MKKLKEVIRIKKYIIAITSTLTILALTAVPAFAHIVVRPNQVGIGAFQTFTTGVPNEKESPTVGLRLVIPEGLKNVSPNVKSGWRIDVKKNGDGENGTVTEIDWTGGSIPAGQRDEFIFSAQAPASETTLKWKAYQTYQDGTVVSWDQEPTSNTEDDSKTPYSTTKVVNDLTQSQNSQPAAQGGTNQNFPYMLSIAALALSAVALYMARMKK